jgi:hypothetical protein
VPIFAIFPIDRGVLRAYLLYIILYIGRPKGRESTSSNVGASSTCAW